MDKPIEEQLSQLANQSKVQVIVSQEHTQEDEISLAELFGVLLSGKKLIALITLVAFLVGVSYVGLNSFVLKDEVGKVETVVSFNFKGIEEGLNPNGEAFEVAEMFNKEILDATLRQVGVGISADKLRQHLQIQQVVPASVQQQINLIQKMAEKDVSQLQKLQEITYYPNQYKLILEVTKEMQMTGEEAEQILRGIIQNYTQYFTRVYGDKTLLSTAITQITPEEYDYLEYSMMADNALKAMESFLKEKVQVAPQYRGKTTGLGFSDLLKKTELLRNIELNNTQAIINSFMLTKDKARLVAVYENNVRNLERELEEVKNLTDSLQEAIRGYQKDTIIVAGQEGGRGTVEVPTSTAMYDQLIQQSIDAQERANEIQYNLQYFRDLLHKLNQTQALLSQEEEKTYKQEAERSIAYIHEQIVDLVASINTTAEEYYTTEMFKNSVRRDMPPMYQSYTVEHIKSSSLVLVITTLLGGILGVLFVLMQGMMVQSKTKEGQGGHHEA